MLKRRLLKRITNFSWTTVPQPEAMHAAQRRASILPHDADHVGPVETSRRMDTLCTRVGA